MKTIDERTDCSVATAVALIGNNVAIMQTKGSNYKFTLDDSGFR